MANKVYIHQETALVWKDSGGDYAMTLNNLGTVAGRQGAVHNFGTAARAFRFAWRAWVKFATTPVVGEAVDIYAKGGDGTHYDNDDGTGDIAVSAADKLKNLTFLGTIIVDEAATGVEMSFGGVVDLNDQYFNPVIWNATADNLEASANVSGFELIPVPAEVQ